MYDDVYVCMVPGREAKPQYLVVEESFLSSYTTFPCLSLLWYGKFNEIFNCYCVLVSSTRSRGEREGELKTLTQLRHDVVSWRKLRLISANASNSKLIYDLYSNISAVATCMMWIRNWYEKQARTARIARRETFISSSKPGHLKHF